MNKFVLIVIVVIIILFLVVKNIGGGYSNNHNGSEKELIISYEINSGIPFKWEYDIEDNSIVTFVKSYVLSDDKDEVIDGANVTTNYVFKGLKEGTTTITFKCISLADGKATIVEKHKVRVDKDLNIKELL